MKKKKNWNYLYNNIFYFLDFFLIWIFFKFFDPNSNYLIFKFKFKFFGQF